MISDYISSYENPNPRKKIICVDDVKYSRLTLKTQLGELYEIYTVVSAVKLFEVLKKIETDLILLDVIMPDMDGFETLVKLKKDERYSKIPVIFITSRGDKESVLKGLSLGAADYFVKPFEAKKLIESIEKHLEPIPKSGDSPLTPNNENVSTKIKEKIEVKPNVLIVDDISSMLRTIHFCLREIYNVTLLSKSEVVIEYLQHNDADIILLDLLMPVISGFDLIPMIKALPKFADTPIIVISTEGDLQTINKVMGLGVKDYIKKPFTENELNEKVEKYLKIGKRS